MKIVTLIQFIFLTFFTTSSFSQNKVVITKTSQSGVVFLGKYNKVFFNDANIKIDSSTIRALSNKKFRNLLKKSQVFMEPTDVKILIHKAELDSLICEQYYIVVGEKSIEKHALKIKNKSIEYILFNEEVFEVKVFSNGKLEKSGFTFVFCKLRI